MSSKTALSAAALNLLAPGSGHLYLGRASRFLLPAFGFVAVFVALGLTGLLTSFAGMATYLALMLGLVVYGVVDGFTLGQRNVSSHKRWYSRWYVILVWILFLWVASQSLATLRERAFSTGMFRVPNPSMSPAIAPGDFVVVDTHPTVAMSSPINSIVAVYSPSLRGTVLRRVRSSPSNGAVRLTSDNPLSPISDSGLEAVPVSEIKGRVTAILWSPMRGQVNVGVR